MCTAEPGSVVPSVVVASVMVTSIVVARIVVTMSHQLSHIELHILLLL